MSVKPKQLLCATGSIGATLVLTTVTVFAQAQTRILDGSTTSSALPASQPTKAPKPASLFIVNDNIFGYY